MQLGHRAVASGHGGQPGAVVRAGGGDQVARPQRAQSRVQFPSLPVMLGPQHGAAQANVWRQIEMADPRFDVGQHLRLHRAFDRQVADGPVRGADLDVLPCRQFAPKTADGWRPFQQPRAEPGTPRVVQVDQAGDTAADDGHVQGLAVGLHG